MEKREVREMLSYLKGFHQEIGRLNEIMELYLQLNYEEEINAREQQGTDLKKMIQAATEYDGMSLTKTERLELREYLDNMKRKRSL